jgi:hypothetical protein
MLARLAKVGIVGGVQCGSPSVDAHPLLSIAVIRKVTPFLLRDRRGFAGDLGPPELTGDGAFGIVIVIRV